MTCARREAGARRPAPSTSADSPHRPEPRPGRSRARLFFLPALALLLGALSLFHAAPAEAQTVPSLVNTGFAAQITNFAVTAGNEKLTLSWTAGQSFNRGIWVQYKTSTATSWTWSRSSGESSPYEITGLTNDTAYDVRIFAVACCNAESRNIRSAFITGSGTPVAGQQTTAPAAPTNLVVSAGDANLRLSWTAPSGTVTGYDVHYTSAPATGNGAVVNNAAASGSVPATAWVVESTNRAFAFDSISGLTNGTTYRVRVRAKNSGGNGAWVFGSGTPVLFLQWAAATDSTAEGAPGALQLRLSVTPISTAVSGTLTYAAGSSNPASLADDLTTGYATTFSAAAGAYPTPHIALAVNDTVNEEHETFTVTINAGTGYTVGTQATLTVTITDNDAPAAPSGLSLTAGNAKLTASWTKPAGPVAGYQLRYKEASATDQTASTANDPSTGWVTSTPSGTGTSADITGLTNGTAYHVQVRATDGQTQTGNGYGDWSASQSGTPAAPAVAAPTGLTVTPDDVQLTLRWTAPSGTVTGYDLHYTSAPTTGSNSVTNSATASGSDPSAAWVDANHSSTSNFADIFSLTNGTTYRVRVRARNADGSSAWVFGSGTPELFLQWPSATASIAEGDTVAFQPRIGPGGSSVSGAVSGTLTYAAGSSNPASLADDLTSGYATTFSFAANANPAIVLPVPVNDTANEEHETFTVTINAGTGYTVGTPSTVTVTINDNDAPAAPSGLSLTAGNAKLTASWTKPAGPVAGYQLRYKEASATDQAATTPGDPSTGWVTSTPSGTTTSADITGLTNGTAYHVQVRATDGQTETGNGYGDWSASQSGTPAVPALAAPTGLTVTPGNAKLTLSWTAPSGTVTGYDVHYTSAPAATVANDATVGSGYPPEQGWLDAVHSGTVTSHNLLHLDNGTLYRVRVRTVNANGNSAWVVGSGTPVAPSTPTVTTPTVSLSASPNPVVEGSSVIVTATLSAPAASALTIPVTVTAGTAESGDFGSLTTIGIAAGATKGTGTITTSHDSGDNDETFTVSLGSSLPSGVLAGSPASVTVTIADDEGNVTVSLGPANVVVSEGEKARLNLVLSRQPTDAWSKSFPVTTTRVTSEWRDHGMHQFVTYYNQGGNRSSSVYIDTKRDGDSYDETFTVELDRANMPEGYVAGSQAKVTVTIRDEAQLPQVSLSVSPERVRSGLPVTVTATLSRPALDATRVYVVTSVGTADRGDYRDTDYVGIDIPAGSTSGTGEVRTRNDDDADDETFTVSVRKVAGYLLGSPSSAEVTIAGRGYGNGMPKVGVSGGSTHEHPSGGVTHATITVWVKPASRQEVRVDYATEDGTARSDGTTAAGTKDYVPVSGTLVFPPGQTETTVDVTVLDDEVSDSGEGFRFVLSNPRGAELDETWHSGAGLIYNRELNLNGLAVEGASGADGPYAALDIGAFDAWKRDYAVTVPYGTTHVRLVPSASDEDMALVTVAGSNRKAVKSGEAGPALALAAGGNVLSVVTRAATGAQRTYRVTVTREAGSSNADLSGLSAQAAGADGRWSALDLGAFSAGTTAYSVTVPYGTTQARLTATAAHAKAALKAGAAGSLSAVSSGSAGAAAALSVGANALAVQVTAEDGTAKTYRVTVTREAEAPYALSVADATVEETSQPPSLLFAVTLDRAAPHRIEVNYRTVDGTAVTTGNKEDGTYDYVPAHRAMVLIFEPGETRKVVRVAVIDDSVEDSGETLKLVLSHPRGAVLADAEATGTIYNDDPPVNGGESGLSSDADVRWLLVQGASNGAGPWTKLNIGTVDADTTEYAVTVPHAVTVARIMATPMDAKATYRSGAGGELFAARTGFYSRGFPLAVGGNSFAVAVTAEDLTVKTYRVTVTREAASSNANLSGLSAQAAGADGRWSGLDLGAFSAGTTAYSVTVPYGTTQARLTATAAHAKAKLKAGAAGNLSAVPSGSTGAAAALSVGANAFTVQVTAEDGTAKTYRVTVTREAASSNADLSGLSAQAAGADGRWSGLDLGAFSAGTTAYSVTVPYGTTQARLTATAAHAKAALKAGAAGSLSAVPSGSAVAAAALSVGANAFTVQVTAEDGTAKTYRVTVTREAASSNADLSGLSAQAAGADGRWSALDLGAFSAGTTAYSVTVPYGTTQARLTATAAHAKATLKAGAAGSLSAVPSGSAVAAVALDVGANAFTVQVTAEDGTVKTYRVTVTREAPPLTAAFENVPPEHDGGEPFAIDLRFSEALGGGGVAPTAASFRVQAGGVAGVERVSAGLWRVRVQPKNWKDVTVTLSTPPDCAATGAVCTADGRALSNTVTAAVGGPVRIRVDGARAKEGKDASLDFAVTLNRAAPHEVSVDYATGDDTATAGADYTATSGTLVFTAGETAKTVSVPVLDDAVDEGKEILHLHLSNPRGAYLRDIHRRARGIIVNDDPLQSMWLSRFGRTVGGHIADAVSDRLSGGLAPGAHATLAGQGVDLSRTDDGRALADTLTGLAQRFGAQAPAPGANDGGPFARHGAGGGWNAPASTLSGSTASTLPSLPASSPANSVTGRELLLGSSFHVAGGGEGSGPGLAAWGRAAHGSFSGEEASDGGRMSLDGEVLTGTLGADADWGPLLAGVAVSFSKGEGTFAQPGVDSGQLESTMTTVSPYARFDVTERVSAWGLAGWGTGAMTIVQDARDATDTQPARERTVTKADLSMRMGALGARGELLTRDEAGGMDLALKADAMFVTTESEKAAGSAATTADASRLRLVLEGGRSFAVSETATLRPSLELGVRHDGGDAETGAGVEIGGGVAYTDAASGLSIEAKARMLVAHADSDYEEWGASATARLDPGERGRGLSFSLAPTIGAASSASERLWAARDARALAPDGGAFSAGRGLAAEMGYGLSLFGDRFTGTPNIGFGMSDGGARDYRIGWRLTSAVEGDPGFEISLDAIRKEPANPGSGSGAGSGSGSGAEHGVMLRSLIRW